ncbi:MAG: hypothetical protein KDK04_20695, partial [Candidatus Competibacteraceae bacterium]|nr:hypothetical protein [Candidatus Competibacteraceae bacterium]
NTSGAGISGSGAGTLTATECSITGTGVGINVSGKILAANFNDISSSNNSGILLNNVSGDFDVSNTVGSIINAGSNIAVNIVGNPSVDLGVTLRSVSANSTSNGMVLTNTTGSFTVIGDGTTGGTLDGLNNGSGGTISSTTGNAISLTNTGPVVIQQMLIGQAGTLGNIDGNGILADGIAALTVRNTDFINVADQSSPDEAAILVINPDAGMGVTLANNLFNRSWDDHVRIENAREGVTAGVVMGTIAITANNFDDNDASGNGNDAVLYVGENNSFATILVQSNRFHNSDGDHIQIALNGSADVESTIGGAGALANNTTSNGMNNVLGSGFTMSSGQGIGAFNFNADPIFRINNNSVQDAVAAAINVNMTATSTGAAVYHSTVNANNVGTDGDANSGGFGITLNQNGAGHLRAVMDDNQVHEYAGDYGQRLAADEGTGRLDVTADNNLVTDATNGVNFDGIGIFAGATSTDASTTCADLTNNDWVVEAIPTEDDDYSMGGLFSGSQIILPGSGFTNEMGAAAIETFLAGQNTSTPDGLFFFLNGHLGVNDGSCNLPLP